MSIFLYLLRSRFQIFLFKVHPHASIKYYQESGQNSQPYEVNIMSGCVSFQIKVQILAFKRTCVRLLSIQSEMKQIRSNFEKLRYSHSTTETMHPRLRTLPAYTAQLLTLHQHRDNNQYRMAYQIQPNLRNIIVAALRQHLNSLPSKY